MRSFAERSREAELMDAADMTAGEYADCLADLTKVNTVVLVRRPTLAWLRRATRGLARGDGFRLVDVGCGQGDMLRAVSAWTRRAGFKPRLVGIDLSPWSAPAARAATDPALGIEYLTGNVFDYRPDEPIDYVISSHVTHHMTDEQVTEFLTWMERTCRRGWFVNDLHRNAIAFYGFKALSAAAGWNRFVRHDGPVSVARSFRRADWERLIAAAELPRGQVSLDWRLPFRLCVGRIR
jgi:2-polyprenyl-3-methyl-5-hydroxy-6-metoxy-1,4-benzoquinol methylase